MGESSSATDVPAASQTLTADCTLCRSFPVRCGVCQCCEACCDGCGVPSYTPTQEQIRETCLAIQSEWSPTVERSRRVMKGTGWLPPGAAGPLSTGEHRGSIRTPEGRRVADISADV